MQRLMESRQMTERESGKLIDVQMSLDQKAALANYVVENSGNFQDLKSQVNFILLLWLCVVWNVRAWVSIVSYLKNC